MDKKKATAEEEEEKEVEKHCAKVVEEEEDALHSNVQHFSGFVLPWESRFTPFSPLPKG